MDIFYEQFIKGQETTSYKIVKVLPFFIIPVGIVLFLFGFTMTGIILIIWGIGSIFLKKFLYIDYEYAFTSGEVDIDQILNRKARRRAVSFHMKNVELLAQEQSEEYKEFTGKPSNIINAFPKNTEEKIYVAVITGGTEKFQLRFVPDGEFINCCFKYNPRAVKKRQVQ